MREKGCSRKLFTKRVTFFNLVELSPRKEDNIPINKGLKNPVMETFFDMTFTNHVNSRLCHIKFSNNLDCKMVATARF